MATLKTDNLQSPTVGSVSVVIDPATGVVTFPNGATITLGANAVLISPIEFTNIIAAAPAATQNIDTDTSGDHLFTTACANNWTLNLRASATVSLNTRMTVGQTKTIAIRVTNAATTWYMTALQIDGVGVTPKWVGGVAPVAGDSAADDIYTIMVTKLAANSYKVVAQLTKAA